MPVAVVTGSSCGIGRATAICLARDGYSVVLHARNNLRGLQQTADEIRRTIAGGSRRVLCITADIACPQSCIDLVTTCFAWQQQVDVWVNNAGVDVLTGAARHQSFEERLRALINVDVLGTVRLSRLVADRMSEQMSRASSVEDTRWPSIINMSWDQAGLGMEGEAGQLFCTCKSAVAAFTSALALSVHGIRVNCVAPGWIKTSWGRQSADEYWVRRATSESLESRWGSPEDVAQAIRWLASPDSQFVNGQTINVNGGRRYYPHPT